MAISTENKDKFELKIYNKYKKLEAKRVGTKQLYRFAAIVEKLSVEFMRNPKTIEKILRKF